MWRNRSVLYVKFSKQELSRRVEPSDGVQSRRRVNSNHQNIDIIIIIVKIAGTSSSLTQSLVTATLDVLLEDGYGVEVGVDGLNAVVGVASNSYKLGVGDANIISEANFVAVC